MRERLIELLDEAIHGQVARTFNEVADYLIDNGVIMSDWIPCSIKEPYEEGKPMKSVLVTMEDYKGYRFVTNTLDKRATKENKVIAWMPVPEAYKGEA